MGNPAHRKVTFSTGYWLYYWQNHGILLRDGYIGPFQVSALGNL